MVKPRPNLLTRLAYAAGLGDRSERELYRLWRLKRFVPGRTDLPGTPVEFPDARSFLYMHDEIFRREIYRFQAGGPSPLFIDGGANIGLATLYVKRLYPAARVVAFEPDEKVKAYLDRNIAAAGLSDVRTEALALWSSATTLRFASEGADAGRVLRDERDRSEVAGRCEVRTARLRDYLGEPVDLLKLDIEGAELEVVRDCADLLGNVRCLFVEYHSFVSRAQGLAELLGMIERAGFRHHLSAPLVSDAPFWERTEHLGMDNQLNVFAYR